MPNTGGQKPRVAGPFVGGAAVVNSEGGEFKTVGYMDEAGVRRPTIQG